MSVIGFVSRLIGLCLHFHIVEALTTDAVRGQPELLHRHLGI